MMGKTQRFEEKTQENLENQKSRLKDGIIHYYRLTTDKMAKRNAFGFVSVTDDFWQFQMQIIDDETILWYKAVDALQFFNVAEQEIDKTVQ